MARGHSRWEMNRQNNQKRIGRRPGGEPARPHGLAARGLAVRALALGGAIGALLSPAHAVVLGEVTVESALGQPLSARVPVTLQAGETMGAQCVSAPAEGGGDLGRLPRPVVSAPETSAPGLYDLRVTTTQALYEPMYELQLQVRCPGTPLVVRQYVLMLDLPGTARPAAAAAAATPAVPAIVMAPETGAAAAPVARPRPARPRAPADLGVPIDNGVRYRVQAGDTLSTIAARVSDRAGQGIWAMADRIFAANPDAFINGNPDLIKLGSEIVIPAPAASADAAATPAATPAPPVEAPPAVPAEMAMPPPATVPDSALAETVPEQVPAAEFAAPSPETAATEPPVFQDEAPQVAAAADDLVAEPPAVVAVDNPPRERGAPAWLAALMGILIGAGVSLALLRERLVAALRDMTGGRKPVVAAPLAAAAAPATAAPTFTRPLVAREPSMVVVEERHADAAVSDPTAEVPAATTAPQALANPALDSDLSRLFGDDGSLDTGLPDHADLDLDLSAATPDGPVDEDIGWVDDDTSLTPTDGLSPLSGSAGDTVEQAEPMDLQTLTQQAGDDPQVSQTLRDALNLLESDYEDELTASQVVDQSKLKKILDDAGEDDTLARTGTDQMPRPRR